MSCKQMRMLLTVVLFTLGISCARAGTVLAGFATEDITPPLNLEMAGFGPFLERKATAIHDPLLAHAMVMELEGVRIAVVDCDVAAVTGGFTQMVRQAVESSTGIPGNRVLISATHTHSGPAIPHWIGWGAQDPDYLRGLPQKVAAAINAASDNLHPVSVFYGEVPVEGIGENREYDNGPVDTKLRVLKFMQGDKMAGFIVNYSVHNVILSEQMHEYSADLDQRGDVQPPLWLRISLQAGWNRGLARAHRQGLQYHLVIAVGKLSGGNAAIRCDHGPKRKRRFHAHDQLRN